MSRCRLASAVKAEAEVEAWAARIAEMLEAGVWFPQDIVKVQVFKAAKPQKECLS